MNTQHINHVNLIGQIANEPKFFTSHTGKRLVKFALKTQETFLDREGNTKHTSNWHNIVAWGKFVSLMSQFGEKGIGLAVEGKLTSNFFRTKEGEQKSFSQVEVNDLIIL